MLTLCNQATFKPAFTAPFVIPASGCGMTDVAVSVGEYVLTWVSMDPASECGMTTWVCSW